MHTEYVDQTHVDVVLTLTFIIGIWDSYQERPTREVPITNLGFGTYLNALYKGFNRFSTIHK